jgi:muramoyltetrapeptide carboxypeptidase
MPRLPRAVPEPATIGVCAPSGRVDEATLAMGMAHMRDLGHRVVVPEGTLHTWRYFAGTDEERLGGLHALLDDPSVDLIIAARGGYGLTRLLPRIDWNRVAASGKAFVGFSDFTAFNMAAFACSNLVTFHGPLLCVDFGKAEPDTFTEQHFWMTLARDGHRIDDIESDHEYGARRIDGTLWGGNLSLLAHLVGTPYFPAIDGGILYVEEVGEEPYAVERWCWAISPIACRRTRFVIRTRWTRLWIRCDSCCRFRCSPGCPSATSRARRRCLSARPERCRSGMAATRCVSPATCRGKGPLPGPPRGQTPVLLGWDLTPVFA